MDGRREASPSIGLPASRGAHWRPGGWGAWRGRRGDGRRLGRNLLRRRSLLARPPGAWGLLAGLGQRLGKPGTALVFLLGLFILSAQIPGEELLLDTLKHTGFALLLFFLLPSIYLQRAAQLVPGTAQQLRSQRRQEERFQRTLAQKLLDVSCMFADLSDKCLIRPPEETNPMDSFLERLGEKACCRCPSYNRCWDESFCKTTGDLIAILAASKARTKIPDESRGRCIRRGFPGIGPRSPQDDAPGRKLAATAQRQPAAHRRAARGRCGDYGVPRKSAQDPGRLRGRGGNRSCAETGRGQSQLLRCGGPPPWR